MTVIIKGNNNNLLIYLFKQYFPKITDITERRRGIVCNIDKYLQLTFYFYRACNTYVSKLWFDDDSNYIILHESTELNELMEVTKQKLTDIFIDWSSKVN